MIHEKIAPGLMVALEAYHAHGAAGLAAHKKLLGLIVEEGSPKPARAVVFIRCEEQANLEHLQTHQIRVNQARGKVRTAFLPLSNLDKLSEEPAIHRIIPSRYMQPFMDVASAHVHVPEFRTKTGLTGKGVIIGIVDSGIDPKHPAFKNRILRIWDQTLPGPGVFDGDYGAEFTGPLITVSRDVQGHGTHVAGIAAGADSTYSGVAPGAELLVVKSSFQEAHIADAVRYIFRVAGELGRPAVVNLSLGGHGDPHDGTDPLSQIIDAESGPGRIVCCAAGNEGNDNIHAQIAIPQGGNRTILFHVPPSAGEDAVRFAALNGWYSGRDKFELAVRSPSGFQTPYQGVISAGSSVQVHDLPDGRVRISTPDVDPVNGDHNFLIEILPSPNFQQVVTPGTWRLRLRGVEVNNGQVDVWTLDNSQQLDVVFIGRSVQDTMKIGSPGAAARAITVASYNTKTRWRDRNEKWQEMGMELNEISDFSSEGPLRNGIQKPDIAAPGAMIASALSADSTVSPAYVVAPGYRVMAGTSMAAPFVTGLVALMLERDPHLDPETIKARLRENSKIPNQSANIFDSKWGYGLIDVLGLIRYFELAPRKAPT
ncbi:MAG: S8 family peptidase [candidate division KSB1 bacterium]|nr:S8 family peptidase [candidate division KSB1 bacterium]MDZ7366923.1 S8 family peptidase [candidate division KSB1 bacterium]MDZ7406092.1 S8 family peptidase [candidate division KSB1 bacterium]